MKIFGAYSVLLAWSAIFLSGPIDSASGWSLQTSTSNSRREVLQQGAAALLGGASLAFPLPALAAATPTPADLEKLRRGHARVKYLLEHWDEETQVCGKMIMSDIERKQVVRTDGGGSVGCEKTPLKVQDYMGYKSTDDPLYRVDKLMVRASSLVDSDDFVDYLEAVEKYKDKADSCSMMAYTSSWGEANPNGGKDVIDEYLDQTKQDVVDSEKYLKQILGYLKLEPMPASKKP